MGEKGSRGRRREMEGSRWHISTSWFIFLSAVEGVLAVTRHNKQPTTARSSVLSLGHLPLDGPAQSMANW